MRVSLFNLRTLRLVAFLGFASLIVNCASDGNNSNGTVETADVDADAVQKQNIVKEAKKVMYSLPSPIETAMLIKRAGAKYNEELLNPTKEIDKYTTNKEMALAMGVYGADLSYASIFEQSQTMMNYMQASKKLAEQLGLLSTIDQSIIDRLEANVNDRDSIIRIISETFLNSNSTLKEDNRPALAALILTGGWVEGLYLATSLTDSISQQELVERIVDQRLSFNELEKLLESNNDDASVVEVLGTFAELKKAFNAIEVETSKIEPSTDPESKVTTLKATSKLHITQEQYDKLREEAIKLRNLIVK